MAQVNLIVERFLKSWLRRRIQHSQILEFKRVKQHSININSHFIKFLMLSLIIFINGPKSLVTLKEKKSRIHIATRHTEYKDGNLALTSSPQSIYTLIHQPSNQSFNSSVIVFEQTIIRRDAKNSIISNKKARLKNRYLIGRLDLTKKISNTTYQNGINIFNVKK